MIFVILVKTFIGGGVILGEAMIGHVDRSASLQDERGNNFPEEKKNTLGD